MEMTKQQIDLELEQASESYRAYLNKDINQKILGKISIYVRILQEGDPENENPKKILDTIEKELEPFEQRMLEIEKQ